VQLEGLGELEKSGDLIGIRTRDLPACSVVPQPTRLPLWKQWVLSYEGKKQVRVLGTICVYASFQPFEGFRWNWLCRPFFAFVVHFTALFATSNGTMIHER
jgi:hypothetical protein